MSCLCGPRPASAACRRAAYNRAMTPALAPILSISPSCATSRRAHADAGLMERAGAAAADVALRLCGDRGRPDRRARGSRQQRRRRVRRGARAAQPLPRRRTSSSPATRSACPPMPPRPIAGFVEAGGTTHRRRRRRDRPGLVIDGLLGIGLARPPEGRNAELVRLGQCERRADPRARHAERSRCRDRAGARAGDPRVVDRDVHRAEAGPAHRRRAGPLRRRVRALARPRDRRRSARPPARLARARRRAAAPCSPGARATSTRARSERWASSAAPKAWAAR